MVNKLIPSWRCIKGSKHAPTEREDGLLKFLETVFKKEKTFRDDGAQKKYNGSLIFVQPFLNDSPPADTQKIKKQ